MRGPALLLALAVLACAGGEPSRQVDGAIEGDPDVSLSPPTPPGGVSATRSADADSPFRNFPLPPDPATGSRVVRHPVRIENGSDRPMIVHASAGAAPVVLDTLEPRGSFRVDLESPAGTLRLSWRAPDGSARGGTAIPPPRPSPADSAWVVRIGGVSGSD